jgi:class 3 adenylate cyclase
VNLGIPGAFADIEVTVEDAAPYFVEVKYGHRPDKIVRLLSRKYGIETPATQGASKLVLVIDSQNHQDWPAIEADLQKHLRPGLQLEVWGEQRLLSMIRQLFKTEIDSLTEENLIALIDVVEQVKGKQAFGEDYTGDPFQRTLLWHFGFWLLKQARESQQLALQDILSPRLHKNIAVVFADLSCFSSFVRDTRDDAIVRYVLTRFCSKSRYQVLNSGGMLYQFLGDGVIGLFGVLETETDYVQDALDCARALIDIGSSISNGWQHSIDHVQNAGGAHIGMALGDLNLMPLRPFSQSQIGAIADSINTAARLTSSAAAGEIVVSNAFFQKLAEESQANFREMEPVDARNIGRIKAWKLGSREYSESSVDD